MEVFTTVKIKPLSKHYGENTFKDYCCELVTSCYA